MSLMIEEVNVGVPGVAVLRAIGPIDAVTAAAFDPAVAALAGNPAVRRLVIDGAGVRHIASAGLRVLLKAVKALVARGGELYAAGLPVNVVSVLKMAGFLQFVQLRPTVAECLSPPPAAPDAPGASA